MNAVDHERLLRLLQPRAARWRGLAPVLQRAVLVQLEHAASRRVARDLGRLLEAEWWAALDYEDAIRAVRVVAYASACADGAQLPAAVESGEPCRRTILDGTLDSLLPPRGRFTLGFADLPHDEGESVVAGTCMLPATAVLNRRVIAACDARLGQGPAGDLEVRVGLATLVHEVNHLHQAVAPGPTYAAFQAEYRAWLVDFVAEVDRLPWRVEALDRCRELLTSPRYPALAQAVTSGSPESARILAFLRAFGPVQRLDDLLVLPRDGWLEPAPLPRPLGNLTNAPPTTAAAMDGPAAAIAGSA